MRALRHVDPPAAALVLARAVPPLLRASGFLHQIDATGMPRSPATRASERARCSLGLGGRRHAVTTRQCAAPVCVLARRTAAFVSAAVPLVSEASMHVGNVPVKFGDSSPAEFCGRAVRVGSARSAALLPLLCSGWGGANVYARAASAVIQKLRRGVPRVPVKFGKFIPAGSCGRCVGVTVVGGGSSIKFRASCASSFARGFYSFGAVL